MKKLYIIALLAIHTVFCASAMEYKELSLDQQLIASVQEKEIDLKKIEFLLKSGAKISAKDNFSRTPLHLAASSGYTDLIEFLIKFGAEIHAEDDFGGTPLHMVADNALEPLIRSGAKVDAKDMFGGTLLHMVAVTGDIKVIKLLIKYGAKIDVKNNFEDTPLHLAANSGHAKVIKILIKNGAKVDVIDNDGKIPLHYAANSGHAKVTKILIENGTKLDVIDNDGRTPLRIAAEKNRLEIVKLLTAAPIVFNNALSNAESETYLTQSKFFEVASKINYTALVSKLPQPAVVAVVKYIFPLNNSMEKKYIKRFALECYKHNNTSLSEIFFNELYKKHLSLIQEMILLKRTEGEAAMDVAHNINDEIVQFALELPEIDEQEAVEMIQKVKRFLNKIVIAKEYADLGPGLKNKIEKNYKKQLELS